MKESQKALLARRARSGNDVTAVCSRGIVGVATGHRFDDKGRIVLTGYQQDDPKKKWESVSPKDGGDV